MNILAELKKISQVYKVGGNIMEYIAQIENTSDNSIESIAISYDFQAGSYIKHAEENKEFLFNYTNAISKVINKLENYESILEVGVGEATTLTNLVPKLSAPQNIYGFDISWSRLKFAQKYSQLNNTNIQLFMGDLFNSPLLDNSIDVVYTSHSIEPNGGREKEALSELYRITKNYLILLEPSYEHANLAGKQRMEKLGYIRNLYQTSIELGYKVIEYRLFDYYSNNLNPTQLLVIKKEDTKYSDITSPFACPISKFPLKIYKDLLFCEESLLAYPILGNIPLLLTQYAVISTHFNDFL